MIPSSKRHDVPHPLPPRSWSDEQPAHTPSVPVSLLPRSSTYGSLPGWPSPQNCGPSSPPLPARVAKSNLPPALQSGLYSPGPSSAHSGFDLFFTTPGKPPSRPSQNLNARNDFRSEREREMTTAGFPYSLRNDDISSAATKPALPPRPYDLASLPSTARRPGFLSTHSPLTTLPHLADSDRSSSVPILPPRPPNDDDLRLRSRSIAFGEGPASPTNATLPTPPRPTVPPKLPLSGYGHLPASLIPAAAPYTPTSVSTPFAVPQTPIAFKDVWEARAVEIDAPIVSRTPSASESLAQSDLQYISVPSVHSNPSSSQSHAQGRHARSLSGLQLQEAIRHSLEENKMASNAVASDADAELAIALHESLIVHPSGQSLRTQLDDGVAAQKEREEEERRIKEEENERKKMEEESERVARALAEEEERERQVKMKRIRQEEEETRRRIESEMEEERIRCEQALAERQRREEEEQQRLLAEEVERARQEQDREQQRLEELEREQLRKLEEEYEMEMRRREEAERERERQLMEKVRKVDAEQKRREEEEQERRDRELARRLEEEQERERQQKLEGYQMEERRREEAEREKQRQLMEKADREQKQREMERKREEEEKRARLEQERADEEVARRLQEEPDCVGEFELAQQKQLELELEQEQRRRREAEQERERKLLEKAKKAERGQRQRERERDETRARLDSEQLKRDEEIARLELEKLEEAKMKISEKARRKSSAATDGGRGAQLYQHYAQRAGEHTQGYGRARPKSSHESASKTSHCLQSQRPKSSHGSVSSSHMSARPPLPTSSSAPHAFSSSQPSQEQAGLTPGVAEAPPQYTDMFNGEATKLGNNHSTSHCPDRQSNSHPQPQRQQQPNIEHSRPQSHLPQSHPRSQHPQVQTPSLRPGRSSSAIAASALREQENLNMGRSSSLSNSASSRARQPRKDTGDDTEEYILKGVAYGFNPPSIRQTPPGASGFPPCPPFPEVITFGQASGQAPPLHIMATSWKHLVSVLAMQDQTRLEADLTSIAHNKERDQCLRVVIQFVKLPYTANIWHTVIHLTLDAPLPLLLPNAHSFTNGNTTTLPYSYTLLPPSSPHKHFLTPSPNTSEIYVIPLSAGSPFPILPITLPNLALYLQSAMNDSLARKVQSDLTNSMRRLARFVGSFYPEECESDAGEGTAGGGSSSSGSGRVTDVFGGILGRVVGRRKKEEERDTVDYSVIVTPFRVDQYA